MTGGYDNHVGETAVQRRARQQIIQMDEQRDRLVSSFAACSTPTLLSRTALPISPTESRAPRSRPVIITSTRSRIARRSPRPTATPRPRSEMRSRSHESVYGEEFGDD